MQAELIKAEREGNACKITALLYEHPNVLDKVVGLAGKEISITLSVPKEKRSLDQNSLLWALIRKIAIKVHSTPEEIYLKLLKEYGQFIVVTIKKGLDLERAGFKYYEPLKDGIFKGKEFTAYKVYIGSSNYTRDEMSVLLDGAITECKELGIDPELEDYIDIMEK